MKSTPSCGTGYGTGYASPDPKKIKRAALLSQMKG